MADMLAAGSTRLYRATIFTIFRVRRFTFLAVSLAPCRRCPRAPRASSSLRTAWNGLARPQDGDLACSYGIPPPPDDPPGRTGQPAAIRKAPVQPPPAKAMPGARRACPDGKQRSSGKRAGPENRKGTYEFVDPLGFLLAGRDERI